MNKNALYVIIVLLTIALVVSLNYNYILNYKMNLNEEKNEEIQQKTAEAYQAGYKTAVIQILQQASTCKPVPLTADNTTLNLIPIECLQQQNTQTTQ